VRRPDADELGIALAAAEALREEGNDPRHIARALSYLYSRNQELEELLQLADRYLRFGMPEHELSEMRRLVDRLREPTGGAGGDPGDHESLPL
jgi:hypothetical protein